MVMTSPLIGCVNWRKVLCKCNEDRFFSCISFSMASTWPLFMFSAWYKLSAIIGRPICHKCTRNWCERPVIGFRSNKVVKDSRWYTCQCVKAALPILKSTFCFGRLGQSPIKGTLIVSDSCSGWPSTRARYCLITCRCSNCLFKCACAGLWRANTIKPEVSISKRCTHRTSGYSTCKRLIKQSL